MAFACFRSLLLRSNVLQGCLQLKANNSLLVTSSNPFSGTATCWNIAFNAPDKAVRDEATALLIELFCNISSTLKELMKNLTSDLTASALQQLEPGPTDPERMDRIIRILQSFITSYP